MNKKRKILTKVIIITLVVLIVVGGIVAFAVKKKQSDSLVKVIPINEANDMFSSENLGSMLFLGNLKEGSVQKINVKSDLEIKEVKVEEGDMVNKGDILLEYDTDSLNLNVAQYQTMVGVLTNSIKIAENDLLVLKGLIPAENAPENPPVQEPSVDIAPVVECEKSITEKTLPLTGDGSEIAPFVFNVTPDCVISKEYMEFLAGEKLVSDTSATENAQQTRKNSKSAIFHIYNNRGAMLYSWFVDGAEIKENDIKDWRCDKGVVFSEFDNIQVEQGANTFAIFVAYNNSTQNSEMPDYDEFISEDYSEDFGDIENIGGSISADDNYVYTKAEIQEMINAKNEEISGLNYQKRQAEIDLKQAEKTLEVGNETATISGKVTFVAKSEKEAIEKGAYITVVNDSVTSVVTAISENDLMNIEVGAKAEISSEKVDNSVMGVVTDISDEISTKIYQDVYDGVYDDTSVYYDVTIELEDKLDVEATDDVLISINTKDSEGAFYLETMFIRTENGRHYVMVANEDNVLEKRYIEVGQKYFSVCYHILSGVTEDDRIALPYGKAVEGAKTVDATYDELFSGYLF